MSEFEFEIIDSSSVEIPVRRRKKKNKIDPSIAAVIANQNKTDDYWKQESRVLFAYSRINERRQMLRNGSYNEDDNPYAHLIDARHRYEIEMETVFHSDCEMDDDTDEVIDEEMIQAFLEESCELFYMAVAVYMDRTMDELNSIYSMLQSNKQKAENMLKILRNNEVIEGIINDMMAAMSDIIDQINDLEVE